MEHSIVRNNNSTFFGGFTSEISLKTQGIMALPPAILHQDSITAITGNFPTFYGFSYIFIYFVEPHHFSLVSFPAEVIPSTVLTEHPTFRIEDYYNNTGFLFSRIF